MSGDFPHSNGETTPLSPRSVHHLFEEQVVRDAGAVAVVGGGGVLSYEELDVRANWFAGFLGGLGVGRGMVVGVCLPRSAELLVALFGVLKCGGVYLPLDVDYPVSRLDFMVADSGASLVVTSGGLAGWFGAGVRVVVVDDLVWGSASGSGVVVRPDELAYVIYTSGSTGTPKGVMIPHGGVCDRMRWRARDFPLPPGGAVVQKTPIGFDGSLWELVLPLIQGARVVLAEDGAHRDTARLAALLRDSRASIGQFVPPMLDAILGEPELAECASIKDVFSGADTLTWDIVERTANALPSARIHNTYGATETSIIATCHPAVDKVERRDGRAVPVGSPLANVGIYVLDGWLQPVPSGVVGEVFVGGVGVARGYVGRGGPTGERFLPDPFCGVAGARMYRTGDLGFLDEAGCLWFGGRVDRQVKVRGFRVEPGEVEAALVGFAGVREAVVVARTGPGGVSDVRLVGYVVADAGVVVEEVREFVAGRLPGHLVPSVVVRVDRLPLTVNGKVDRDALPPPPWQEQARPVRVFDGVQARLAAVWSEVLGVSPGVDQNFFDLGGNSLLLIKLGQRVSEEFAVRLEPVTLFRHPTIRSLAAHLQGSPDGVPRKGRERGRTRRTRRRSPIDRDGSA